MKQTRSVNVSDEIWNRIPVHNKSRFTEFALLEAIESFKQEG